MTQKYIRTAEELQAGFGEPFPVLPLAVVRPKTFARKSLSARSLVMPSSETFTNNGHTLVSMQNLAGRTGLEPVPVTVTTCHQVSPRHNLRALAALKMPPRVTRCH